MLNHKLQRARRERRDCNPCVLWAGPLSLGRYAASHAIRKRTFIAVGLILVLAACVIACLTVRSEGSLNLTVSFTGYTNDGSGARLALFRLTNQSDTQIRRWGVYHVEVRGDAQRRGPLFHGRNAFVEPGHSTAFALPAYTNGVAWRAALHCSRDGCRRSFSDFTGGLPLSISQFVPRRFQGVPVEIAWSDWIEK